MRPVLGAAIVLALTGCGDVFGPTDEPRLGIEARPAVVAPGDSFDIHVTVINPSPMPVEATSGCGGLWYWLFAEHEDILFSGGPNACLTVIAETTIPGGTTRLVHRGRLENRDGTPAGPGSYQILIETLLHGFFEEAEDGRDRVTVLVE